MSKEELKELLKENLVLELYEEYSGGTKYGSSHTTRQEVGS
jgi:hypothetical protein